MCNFIEDFKSMVHLTRRERFTAAHKLYNNNWSEEKNKSVFGKCANANWHGHNYELFVTVKGVPDVDTGFVMDAKLLGDIIKERVIEKCDHANLNLDVDFIPSGSMATTENLTKLIWDELEPYIKGCKLHCVRLHETENIYAEYFG